MHQIPYGLTNGKYFYSSNAYLTHGKWHTVNGELIIDNFKNVIGPSAGWGHLR